MLKLPNLPPKNKKWKHMKIVFTITKKPYFITFKNIVKGDEIAFIPFTIRVIKTVVFIENNYVPD